MKLIPFNLKCVILILLIFTTNSLVNSTLQAQLYRSNLYPELFPSQVSHDSALIVLDEIQNKAILEKDTAQIIKSMLSISSINRAEMIFGAALNFSGEALFLAEEYNDTLLLAKAHEEFAIINFIFMQNMIAGKHFEQSLILHTSAYEQNLISASELFLAKYYVMQISRRLKNTKKVRTLLGDCYHLLATTDIHPINKVYLDREMASLWVAEGKAEQAKDLLINGAENLEAIKWKSKELLPHKKYLMIMYSSLADIYLNEGDFSSAKLYYKKAVSRKAYNGELVFTTANVFSKYSSFLQKTGEYKEACKLMEREKKIYHNFSNPRKSNTQGFLSLRNSYSDKLRQKNEELNLKNLELAENHKKILRFRILFFIILFLLILGGLLLRYRILRLKHKSELEANNKMLQESELQLTQKNRELTTSMLQLIEKNEALGAIREQIKNSKDKNVTLAMISSFEKQSENLWDTFNSRFISLNKGFYERLQTKFPELGSNDLKICALIKLNFSGKEMASLMGISLGGIHLARHRLRKKMNIGRDVNLTGFINSI